MVTLEKMQSFLEEFAYPEDACQPLLEAYGGILRDETLCARMDEAEERLFDAAQDRAAYLAPLAGMAQAVGTAPQTIPLLCLMQAAFRLHKMYREARIPEQIWRDTMLDVRTKVMECRRLDGVYGLFGTVTPVWMVNYDRLQRFALGRLQYEIGTFKAEECTIGSLTLRKGDPVLCCHIPSDGRSFDEQARLASYRAAYAFYRDAFPAHYNGCVPITCDSWLLFPDHAFMLGARSNIAGFMRQFRLLRIDRAKTHPNLWRIFWTTDLDNAAALPADSGLQRAYKQRLLSGGDVGGGYGIFLFDGENILK